MRTRSVLISWQAPEMPKDPTGRALQLLALLQTHRLWGAAELAEHLEVTERTVRRDVDRLRELGYPVDATPGRDGGYRLATGSHLPPLTFDDAEAVAVVVGLRAAASAAIAGIEETSLRALTKVERALPDRLRRRVSALDQNLVSLQRAHRGDAIIDPEALSLIAGACRDHEEVRFDYQPPRGDESRRLVEPHQLLSAGHLWYLVAWDLRRNDWRTFRLDRLSRPTLAGARFTPREIPEGDAAAHLAASVASMPRQIEAVVAVGAPYDRVAEALSWAEPTPLDTRSDSCTVRLRTNELDQLVAALARAAQHGPVQVVEPASVAAHVDALSDHLEQRDR